MRLLLQSLRLMAVFTALTGVIYPLLVTGLAQILFHAKANGSLIERAGQTVGSALLSQSFKSPRYFWPRPSAGDYAAAPSGASNLGPTSAALRSNVLARASAFRSAHLLPADAPVSAEMLFASGSGLDPHISPEAAREQAARVAHARGLAPRKVRAIVEALTERRQFFILGEPRVNILLLNLWLDDHTAAEP